LQNVLAVHKPTFPETNSFLFWVNPHIRIGHFARLVCQKGENPELPIDTGNLTPFAIWNEMFYKVLNMCGL